MKRNEIEFEVSGRYALFSDPIMRVGGEKFSYQVPTYEALKGICASVYWKPSFIWVVDAVRVMNPIQTEVKGVRPVKWTGGNDLAYYTYLKDCRYQVKAHIEWNKNRPEFDSDRNMKKHLSIAKRMIESGGRRDVFLGTRECQAYVKPCVFGEGKGAYDEVKRLGFGLMLHGFTYPDESYSKETKGSLTARFWSPVMNNGMIKFLRPEMCQYTKRIRSMEMKEFNSDMCSEVRKEERANGTVAKGS